MKRDSVEAEAQGQDEDATMAQTDAGAPPAMVEAEGAAPKAVENDRRALVRWCGFNPDTGAAWEDSWVGRNQLTADLRSGGIIRRRRTAAQMLHDQQVESEQYRSVQRRRTPRVAGEAPGPGML